MSAESDDLKTQELRLAHAQGKRDGFEESARACDWQAESWERSTAMAVDAYHEAFAEASAAASKLCASRIREIQAKHSREAARDLKKRPGWFDGSQHRQALEKLARTPEAAGFEFSESSAKTNVREFAAMALALQETLTPGPEDLAKLFHETYETLAPDFGYETREASRKPWLEVPEKNRKLMIAVCERILRVLT